MRGIALQVGAFRQPEHAEAVRARLASQFPDVHVSPFVHDGTTLYGVRVGRFASEADLALAAAAMRAAGFTPLRVRD